MHNTYEKMQMHIYLDMQQTAELPSYAAGVAAA